MTAVTNINLPAGALASEYAVVSNVLNNYTFVTKLSKIESAQMTFGTPFYVTGGSGTALPYVTFSDRTLTFKGVSNTAGTAYLHIIGRL